MSLNPSSAAGDFPREPIPTETATPAQTLDRTRGDARSNPMWWAILAAAVVGVVVWGIGETRLVKFEPGITDIAIPGGSYKGFSSDSRRVADIKEVRLRTALL